MSSSNMILKGIILFYITSCDQLMVKGVPILLEMVDMTHVFDNDTLYWPDQRKFELSVIYNGTVGEVFWLQVENYFSGTHVGTHLDAPCHTVKGKWSVDQIPLNHLIAPAAVIDIIDKARVDRDYLVKVEDLEIWERITGQSLNGTIVMLRSGWGRRWPDREAYTGTPGNDTSKFHFPGLSKEASQWLVDKRSIYGLGTETLSVDNGSSQDFPAHRILYERNIFGLENVANMEEIPIYGATLHVSPMKIGKASGAPVRIIATFPKITVVKESAK